MSNYAGKQTRSQIASDAALSVQQSVGKRTLVEQAPAPVAGVQQRAQAEAAGTEPVHAAAARGVATPSSALPNGEAIQRSFGRHDVSSVQAHVGGEAAQSARSMGAEGYATGNHVVLAKSDLFTEAHEAAHVVQQRGGVQLKGGVGQVGDPYEQHADQVASLVVQGKSAESLLDSFAGPSASGPASAGAATQFKLTIGGRKPPEGVEQTDIEAVWARISADPRLAEILEPAKALLTEWITKEAAYEDPSQISENRHYQSDEQLIRALVGDLGAKANLKKEGELADQTLTEGIVNALLESVLQKLAAFHNENKASLSKAKSRTGRYAGWTYEPITLAQALEKDPGDLHGRISFIADYALAMRRDIEAATGVWDFRMSGELNGGRHTHHNTNEDSPWIQGAREAQVLSVTVGCSKEEREALAWALFCLWNIMPLHKSGTHRFHEVMAVAVAYDVSYERFQYSEPPKNA
jgi:Domain of unknown function (DUF4157)